MFKCLHCGKTIETSSSQKIQCTYCGYRVLLRTRQPVIKKVKSR
ncbi:MAG: DNA-directed RNA polymerase subunit P [Candidatus Aenigmatarchaeota archaeon]